MRLVSFVHVVWFRLRLNLMRLVYCDVLRMNLGAEFCDVFLLVTTSGVFPEFQSFGLGDLHHRMIRQLHFFPSFGGRVEVAGIYDAA